MVEIDKRQHQLINWLEKEVQFPFEKIEPASEDASFRRYFRIYTKNETCIVMDAPPEKESCNAFIDVTQRLLNCQVNVPAIIDKNLEEGFLLLTDLGNDQYLDVLSNENADSLYSDAITALVKIQVKGNAGGLPAYDESLLLTEMLLFREWLLKSHLNIELSTNEEGALDNCFSFLIEQVGQQQEVFVHRDYHSRNLLYTNDNNPGILDYQDAVSGPVTYDLVSLLKDCYIKWADDRVQFWVAKFYEEASQVQTMVSKHEFINQFHLMGVQRQLKASGIFARLFHRDNKTGYLKDIERTLGYILDLKGQFNELSGLIQLLESRVLPALTEANKKCTS